MHNNRSNNRLGRISNQRDSWVTVKPFEAILFVGDRFSEPKPNQAGYVPPPYPTHKIELRTPQRRILNFELTAMTADEVRALKAFYNLCFDKAIPVCEMLDKDAEEAFARGDDSYARLYRPEAQVFTRITKEDGTRVAVPIDHKE